MIMFYTPINNMRVYSQYLQYPSPISDWVNIIEIFFYRYFEFGFFISTTELKIEKETLVYPTLSFISELGGSLGLFLGFSFFTLFDYFDWITLKVQGYTSMFR